MAAPIVKWLQPFFFWLQKIFPNLIRQTTSFTAYKLTFA